MKDKPARKSVTIWGAITAAVAAVLPTVLPAFGVDPEQAKAIATVIAAIGGAVGVYGARNILGTIAANR